MNKIFLDINKSSRLYRLLGDKVSTQFFYAKKDKQIYDSKNIYMGVRDFDSIYVPAYTDGELNRILPDKVVITKKGLRNVFDLVIRKTRTKYIAGYENPAGTENALIQIPEDSEVEAKASMLFYLFKNNLLK
ncbi:MAG: hypothetical protein HGGPFJEG_01444 [Ignavibacteria bacterium]|nr:hypothetical protein [Ignavibacteria bacterium]